MKRLLLLLALAATPCWAAGTLVKPDSSTLYLGQSGNTWVLPRGATGNGGWLLFPRGSLVTEVELTLSGARRRLAFPSVNVPQARFAVWVPPGLLSVGVQGILPAEPVFRLSAVRPADRGPWVTRTASQLTVELPPWSVAPGYTADIVVNRRGSTSWRATAHGAEQRSFTLASTVTQWHFSPAAWGLVPSALEFPGTAGVTSVRVTGIAPTANLPADPSALLAWPVASWRQAGREWFAWTGTSVLVLITRDYDVQDRYLRRLAFYVEKTGFRGKLWTDEQLGARHGWNAHDYAAPDLARFFTDAARQAFALGPEERELRERLVSAGILKVEGTGWAAGEGALIGISAESPPSLRNMLFVHEGYHGLYFTSTAFQSGVALIWNALSEPARQAFRSFLALSQYDPSNEALMTNEFQAYTLQRPASQWADFFRNRVLAVAGTRVLPEFLAAAHDLEVLVRGLYGLPSGAISLVTTP